MLIVQDLVYRIMGRLIFEGASVNISDGWRVGIVGANGAGKTTLFKLITGELEADGGEVKRSGRQRLGVVRQDMPDSDEPLLDLVLAADEQRAALLLASETEQDPYKISEIHEQLGATDAYAAPGRAAGILAGLGFSPEQMQRPFSSFSGGWRMRVALAAALFQQPELLLLDEPTNHLDLEAIMWLEGYLATYPGTLLVISHDRDLLNKCADHILHVHDKKLTIYGGNYDTFERERAERLGNQQKLHEKQQAQRAHMQKFIDRFRYKATKARQAQSRIKLMEKMELVDAVLADRATRFTFPQPEELPPPLIAINEADIGYTAGKPILRNVHDNIDMDDRIALLGANGNGKSTLIKLLAGKLKPLSGEMIRPSKLRIGYFSQHQAEEMDVNQTPYQAMLSVMQAAGEDPREPVVRGKLGQFNFSKPLSDNKIGDLSGGEKARLLFALMSYHKPHMLLLDEPTNHLDIEAREALVHALNDYEGAVVIVSHDPHMIERVADRLWLVADGGVRDFDGDLADYRKYILAARRQERKDVKVQRADDKKEAKKREAEKRAEVTAAREKAEALEQAIARLTVHKDQLEAVMAKPDFYAGVPAKVQDVQQTHGQIVKEIARQEALWLDLHAKIEAAERVE